MIALLAADVAVEAQLDGAVAAIDADGVSDTVEEVQVDDRVEAASVFGGRVVAFGDDMDLFVGQAIDNARAPAFEGLEDAGGIQQRARTAEAVPQGSDLARLGVLGATHETEGK